MSIDKRILKHINNWYKGDSESMSDEEFAVNTFNLLLCHTGQPDLQDTINGLFLVIDRLGLEKHCHVKVQRMCDQKLKAFLDYTEPEEPPYILAPLEDPWEVAVRDGKVPMYNQNKEETKC